MKKANIKVRIITIIVALIIVVPLIWVGGIPYYFLVGMASILALKEVIDLKKSHKEIPFIMCVIAMISCLSIVYTNFDTGRLIYGITYKRIIFCMLSLLIPIILYKKDRYTSKEAFYLIGYSIFLGLAFNSFILVREMNLKTFIYLVLIPISTDTLAYIIGSMYGKHKMCPLISPNKSWEGFSAGLIAGTIIPSLIYYFLLKNISWQLVLCTAILSVMGQLGDIIFSKIKRENEIKDFSNLMPGHGGMLDRLDSTIIIFMAYIFLSTVLF